MICCRGVCIHTRLVGATAARSTQRSRRHLPLVVRAPACAANVIRPASIDCCLFNHNAVYSPYCIHGRSPVLRSWTCMFPTLHLRASSVATGETSTPFRSSQRGREFCASSTKASRHLFSRPCRNRKAFPRLWRIESSFVDLDHLKQALNVPTRLRMRPSTTKRKATETTSLILNAITKLSWLPTTPILTIRGRGVGGLRAQHQRSFDQSPTQ